MEPRQIKFRLWFAGQMFYNVVKMDCLKGEVKKIYVNHDDEDVSIDAADTWTGQDDYVLQQFTGETDKNGKEIFEGDIVRISDDFDNSTITTVRFNEGAYIVEWDGHFGIDQESDITSIGWAKHEYEDIEVIGNIYEHKHLLA